MLRMNTKKAIENAKRHFLEYYDGDAAALIRGGQAAAFSGSIDYQKGVKLAQGGAFACYYWDERDAIKEILEETEQEAARFSDDEVFKTYCHLAGRVYEVLKKEQSKNK